MTVDSRSLLELDLAFDRGLSDAEAEPAYQDIVAPGYMGDLAPVPVVDIAVCWAVVDNSFLRGIVQPAGAAACVAILEAWAEQTVVVCVDLFVGVVAADLDMVAADLDMMAADLDVVAAGLDKLVESVALVMVAVALEMVVVVREMMVVAQEMVDEFVAQLMADIVQIRVDAADWVAAEIGVGPAAVRLVDLVVVDIADSVLVEIGVDLLGVAGIVVDVAVQQVVGYLIDLVAAMVWTKVERDLAAHFAEK